MSSDQSDESHDDISISSGSTSTRDEKVDPRKSLNTSPSTRDEKEDPRKPLNTSLSSADVSFRESLRPPAPVKKRIRRWMLFLSSLFYDHLNSFFFFTCNQLKRVGVKILRVFLRQLLTRASWNKAMCVTWSTFRCDP
jgi:hypothetical protein